MDYLRSGVPDQPGQHSETTPSLLKIKNYLDVLMLTCNPIRGTQEAEAGESLKLGGAVECGKGRRLQ